MSKVAARPPDDGDSCPVCKSARYLNPNMQFKVNPECYHKMCEACVDRIFSHGPAPCPIAGCSRTLRKAKFRRQTFGDLQVERECDIRRRVAAAMDKQQDDFETLKDYNDYLEIVEDITWNLILNIDAEATEARLRRWEEHQKAELNPTAVVRRRLPIESTDPAGLRKGATQRRVSGIPASREDPRRAGEDAGFTFYGLKKRVAPPPEAPFDPFEGWSVAPSYFVLQDTYDVDWITQQGSDPAHQVGGYFMADYYSRALREAFGGLGVSVDDEMKARINLGENPVEAPGVHKVLMEDIF